MRKNKEDTKTYNKFYYLVHAEQFRKEKKEYRLAHPEIMKAWKLANPEYAKTYRLTHLEQFAATNKRFQLAHPERRVVSTLKWQAKNPEKKKKYEKKYCLTHSEKRKENSRKWYLTNHEYAIMRSKQYNQTSKGKEVRRKTSAKRREFGFMPLNKPFEDSTGHHIDRERVIYIPKELHKSIPHSVLRNRNMERINEIAFNFLRE